VTSSPETDAGARRRERRFVLLTALAAMLLTLVPYLIGAALANGRQYMWLGYNLDDSCVYLTWMQQASAGSLRAYNLFTTDPQRGILPNPLFFALGLIHRVTGLPLLALYHLARLGFGFGLLLVVYTFLRMTVADPSARRLGFLFVCFSAGLGWLPFWWPDAPIQTPIDKWQPEAITFLSLYLSPLFCFSLALQVGILTLLQQAERTGHLRYALWAGLCGLVLGFVHTYDIITMAAVWACYLVVRQVLPLWNRSTPPLPLHAWWQALIAGVLTAPSVAYIAWQLHTELVFQQRAEVKTTSPSLRWVLLGYGLLLILALISLFAQRRTASTQNSDPMSSTPPRSIPPDSVILLAVWAIMNLAVSYIPVAFQRKMLQGEHFPIAILAGVGAAWILSRPALIQPAWRSRFASALLILFLSLTNLLFVMRDVDNYAGNRAQTGMERTYLEPGEIQALNWIEANTPPDSVVQALPWLARDNSGKTGAYDITLACFTPGMIHRKVFCGHWGETPDFGKKLSYLKIVTLPSTPDEQRIAMLSESKIQYLVFSQKKPPSEYVDLVSLFLDPARLPPYLIKCYSNDDADVYEVKLPR